MSRVLASASAADRPATDFYPTPRPVTEALIAWADWPRGLRVWEPAAGNGDMVLPFKCAGYDVIATDLHWKYSTDFTTETELRGDVIVTNPPFKLAEQFIRKAHELQPVAFAFLLKSQYWHAAKRVSLFRDIPPMAVLPLAWRPDFHMGAKGGRPTMDVCWAVWSRGYTGETMYLPLERTGTC